MSWHFLFSPTLLPRRTLHVWRVHSPEHPLELGARVNTEAPSPMATKRRRLPSCPGNGWCARWWPWMYLPYLTRPELCVTQPWRQSDMTQLLPNLCSCVDSRHSIRCGTPSTLRARQLSDSRHIFIASEISLRPRASSLNYFVRGTFSKTVPTHWPSTGPPIFWTLVDCVCYLPSNI